MLLDDHLRFEHRWETLVQPRRDIGASHIHGIHARDVVDAPEFSDIADQVVDLLTGRVVVAHNARFDTGFLSAELRRAGVGDIDLAPHSLCTMRLAPMAFPGVARTLTSCCEAAGVSVQQHHRALDDATATASLLACLVRHPVVASEVRRPRPFVPTGVRLGRPVRPVCVRPSRSVQDSIQDNWMSRIAASMPRLPVGPAEESYLAVLDRALEDKLLSGLEVEELIALATALNLDQRAVGELHTRYLWGMAALAWADGVVTHEERADLQRVARQLGFSDELADRLSTVPGVEPELSGGCVDPPQERVEDGLEEAMNLTLRPGDRVTFTGDMAIPRDEWQRRARDKGLDVGGVTKKSALVVAADTCSFSGKAKKAREYGIPLVNEAVFARLLGEMG